MRLRRQIFQEVEKGLIEKMALVPTNSKFNASEKMAVVPVILLYKKGWTISFLLHEQIWQANENGDEDIDGE